MKNPNAVTAWVAGHVVIAAEQIAQTYFHRHLGSFWAKEIGADTIAVVLLVGRDGISGAISRGWAVLKSVWKPQPATPAA